jgi:hypothetical protein
MTKWESIKERAVTYLMWLAFWGVVALILGLAIFFGAVEFMAKWRLAFGTFK